MESVKNLFMENVGKGKHVLIHTIKVKLRRAKNINLKVIALMEKDVILVMTLKSVRTLCDKNVRKESIAHIDMCINTTKIVILIYSK